MGGSTHSLCPMTSGMAPYHSELQFPPRLNGDNGTHPSIQGCVKDSLRVCACGVLAECLARSKCSINESYFLLLLLAYLLTGDTNLSH